MSSRALSAFSALGALKTNFLEYGHVGCHFEGLGKESSMVCAICKYSQKISKKFPKIRKKFAKNFKKISKKFPKIRKKFAKNFKKISKKFAKNFKKISKNSQKFAKNLQKFAKLT